MKRIFFNLFLLSFKLNLLASNQINSQTNNSNNNQDEIMSAQQAGRLATVVGLFGNVLGNPNDPRNVASSICGIIANIIGMAADTRSLINLELQANANQLNQANIEFILSTGNPDEIMKLQAILKTLCEKQIKSLSRFTKMGD
jgi:hypothetical protein